MSVQPRGVIYCRVSSGSETDDESTSIPEQIDACKIIAAKEGIEVIDIIDDKNRSGRTWHVGAESIASVDFLTLDYLRNKKQSHMYREGLGRVVSLLPQIQYVIVRDLQRLYRPVANSLLLTYLPSLFVQNKVNVITQDKGVIPYSDVLKWSMEQFFSSITSEEVNKRKQQSMVKTKKLRDEGYLYSKISCYGYISIGRQELQIIPEEIMIVKEVFKLFEANVSLTNIARKLNAKYKTRHPSKGFTPTHIKGILVNPHYIGKQYNTRNQLIDCKVLKPVVKESAWYKAKTFFEHTRKLPKRLVSPSSNNCLSGILFCGCGQRLYYRKHHADRIYYKCPNGFLLFEGSRVDDNCKQASVNTIKLQALLIYFLPFLRNYKRADDAKQTENELSATKQVLDRLHEKEKKLIDLIDNEDQFRRLSSNIHMQIEEAEVRYSILLKRYEEAKGETLIDYLKKQTPVELRKIPTEQQNVMFRALFEKVVITRDNIELYFRGNEHGIKIQREMIGKKHVFPHVESYIGKDSYYLELTYRCGLKQIIGVDRGKITKKNTVDGRTKSCCTSK